VEESIKSKEMNSQEKLDYVRVAEAIEYIRENFKSQPTLEDVANKVCLSPTHFQRLFTA
jgi:AraC family transcriptional regulator of adaptative response/methylated-DNA-[protein]-cysteine methyltransferase